MSWRWATLEYGNAPNMSVSFREEVYGRHPDWLACLVCAMLGCDWLARSHLARCRPGAQKPRNLHILIKCRQHSQLTPLESHSFTFSINPLAASLMWAIVGSGSSSSSSSSCSPDLRHMYSLPGVISHVMCHYARGVYQKPAVFLGNILGAHFFPGKHRTLHLMRFDHQPKQRHLLREP